MFGVRMLVNYDGFAIRLRPFRKEDLPGLAEGFSSMKVGLYTNLSRGCTVEDEEEWLEQARKNKSEMLWAIALADTDEAIGSTAIHRIDDTSGSCSTGIIIYRPKYWGRGVASRAHLARTLYAADFLNRLTIVSSVRTDNAASRKALEGVGYMKTGIELRSQQREGRFIDTYRMCWLHPERIQVLYPEGLPREYEEGVERAKVALEKSRRVVSFE